jgi:glycosyltransferase involved in cell wall biosynthesis
MAAGVFLCKKKKEHTMKLSIIIPVYNEEKTLSLLIERVVKAKLPDGFDREIILVDDASSDKTSEVIASLPSSIIKLSHIQNEGKGASVIDGLKRSTGDIVVIQDADLEYNPNDFSLMLPPILEGNADVVYGSRLITNQPHRVLFFWHYLGNKFLTFLSNLFTNLNLTDMETCYKMFSRNVVDDIKNTLISKRFGIEPEITARVKNYRIYEVGISYSGRTYKEGKKIGWKDGFSALWCIVHFNIFP